MTLNLLALVFVLHYYKLTLKYFMDIIDASLYYKNVAIIGDYIKGKIKSAYFIVINIFITC